MAMRSILASIKVALRALNPFHWSEGDFEENLFTGYGATKQKGHLKFLELFQPVIISHGPLEGRLALISGFHYDVRQRAIAYHLDIEDQQNSSPGNRRFISFAGKFNDNDVVEAPSEIVVEIAEMQKNHRLMIIE